MNQPEIKLGNETISTLKAEELIHFEFDINLRYLDLFQQIYFKLKIENMNSYLRNCSAYFVFVYAVNSMSVYL